MRRRALRQSQGPLMGNFMVVEADQPTETEVAVGYGHLLTGQKSPPCSLRCWVHSAVLTSSLERRQKKSLTKQMPYPEDGREVHRSFLGFAQVLIPKFPLSRQTNPSLQLFVKCSMGRMDLD